MNRNERSYPRIDSDLLRTFVAVAECRNVTRASQALGRTQSAISVQIRKLETALSVTLFEREARGMALTKDGEMLLTAARPLIRDLDRVGSMFSDSLSGRVRVGIPDDYGTAVLETILADFSTRHPDVEVAVRCGFSVGFPEAIERDELDLAVYACDSAENPGRALLTERTVWAANENWCPRADEPVALALFDRKCWWREAAIDALRRAGRPFRIAFTSESVSGVTAAIASGLAIGMLAQSTVQPGMRVLSEGEGFPDLPPSTLALLRNTTSDSETVDAMEAAIREGFRGLPFTIAQVS